MTFIITPNGSKKTDILKFRVPEGARAWLSEGHTLTVAKTNYPIESGKEVIDHAILRPPKLRLTGMISAYDLPKTAGISDHTADNILGTNLDPDLAGFNDVGTEFRNFPQRLHAPRDESIVPQAFKRLREMARDRELVTVITKFGTYSHMLVTRIKADVDITTGDNLLVEIEFEEIQIAGDLVSTSVNNLDPDCASAGSDTKSNTGTAFLTGTTLSVDNVRTFLGAGTGPPLSAEERTRLASKVSTLTGTALETYQELQRIGSGLPGGP